MTTTINPKVATWMAQIAEALVEIRECDPGWGTFYVSNVEISFDGEESGYRVVPDDHGTYELAVAPE